MTDQDDDLTPEQRYQRDVEELAALGISFAPADHWIYRQGTTFIVPDPPLDDAAEPTDQPPARPRLRRLPPDDPIYQSAWVLFPSGEQHLTGQDDLDGDAPDALR